jgi:hypothetical protein
MHRELAEAAAASQRSISEEIEFRLTGWSSWLKTKGDIDKELAAAKTIRSAAGIQAIRESGLRILRESDGVSVIVSPEMLIAEAEGILGSFVTTENANKPLKTLMEEATMMVLEKAAMMVLEKAQKAGLLLARSKDSEAA